MNKFQGLMITALMLTAVSARASEKIIMFDSTVKGSIEKTIESIGGKVTRKFVLLDALVAAFPGDMKNAGIYSIKGVTDVDDDSYLSWIESSPASMNSVPLPTAESALSTIREGGAGTPPVPSDIRPVTDPAAEKEIPWGVKRLNAPSAWDRTDGQGVKVAVIDTGIDYDHEDLAQNYSGGYNAIITTDPPLDDHGHGTHVGGTIAAARNLKGVAGVAPRAALYGVKVLDKRGSGQYSWIVAGIEWAIINGMDVINMSLGGGNGTETMRQIMIKAGQAGVTVVCAAGNDSGPVNYPARYPQAIAVSASDSSDKLASFSSKGPEIAVIAPGVDIYSAKRGGGYRLMSGTSMASPHVAGLAALAVGAGAKTPEEVRTMLKAAASPLPALKPTDQGAGIVDAAKLR